MRVRIDPRLSEKYDRLQLTDTFREIANQLNAITEGNMHAHHGAMTAAPATGSWAQGDFVLNSAPSEAGIALSKYIIHGWRCTVSGSPGTWVEMRFLTGN